MVRNWLPQACRRPFGVPSEGPVRQPGIVLLDLTGRVTAASEHAAGLLGFDGTAALIGRVIFDENTMLRADGTALGRDEQPAVVAARTGRPQPDTVIGFQHRPGAARSWLRLRAEALTSVGALTPYAVVTRFVPLEEDVQPSPVEQPVPLAAPRRVRLKRRRPR